MIYQWVQLSVAVAVNYTPVLFVRTALRKAVYLDSDKRRLRKARFADGCDKNTMSPALRIRRAKLVGFKKAIRDGLVREIELIDKAGAK